MLGVRLGVKMKTRARQEDETRDFLRMFGAGDGTRTRDLLITNQLLYQLSYAGQ